MGPSLDHLRHLRVLRSRSPNNAWPTASFDYFELKYPHEGLRGGFIYKTVPHVMLKSIANNPGDRRDLRQPASGHRIGLGKIECDAEGQAISFVVSEGGRKGEEVNFAAAASKTFTLPTGDKAPVNALLEWECLRLPGRLARFGTQSLDAFHAARRQAMQQKMDEASPRMPGRKFSTTSPR